MKKLVSRKTNEGRISTVIGSADRKKLIELERLHKKVGDDTQNFGGMIRNKFVSHIVSDPIVKARIAWLKSYEKLLDKKSSEFWKLFFTKD
jgi:hypothetical protein